MSETVIPTTVRPGTPADRDTIAAFQCDMARETEQKKLDAATVRTAVAWLLEHPEQGFYLVAERDGEPAGCLMISFEWSDWRNGLFWWIQSVYVASCHRRQGVYRALYAAVRTKAQAAGNVRGIRLYVEQDNAVAQQVYARLGMERLPYLVMESLCSNTE